MARKAISCAISRLADHNPVVTNTAHPHDPVNATTMATTTTDAEAALAVLEADAASPTQGHVDAMRAAFDLMKADIAVGLPAHDVIVVYNASAIVTSDTLRLAINQMLDHVPPTL